MHFGEELEELVRKQESFDEIVFDPITRCRGSPPYVLCSDSRIYSASSLRGWARTCLSEGRSIRSMMDNTYLKPRAENVTRKVIAAARSVGIDIPAPDESDFPWIERKDVDIVVDVAGVKRKKKGGVGDGLLGWNINIASKLRSDLASATCVLAGIEGCDEIRIECATRREPGGRITLLAPPPDPRLRKAFAALADEMEIGAGGMTNPECIGTSALIIEGEEDDLGTLEDRILFNFQAHKKEGPFQEMWNTVAENTT